MSAFVRAMREDDLERVLSWRNHPDVRQFMYTRHAITPSEHRKWYESSQLNSARSLLIFEQEEEPLGFVNITQTVAEHIADWGFYLAPGAPRGAGRQLGEAALAFAFDSLGLHKVCGQALAFNERSIRFHEKLGFVQEGALRDQHYDGTTYHTIIHFGLLQHEWQAKDRDTHQ
ncbi:UDP-4-amino-4,6-dideoxy-N-acetyl-beta-L-altrosamine N-acetyltransferase [Pseudomonas matsuisoli]|uniref:UDP-4-amino-4, 6-dideoxy-N-acetyl-beta-L-altrosamine N-acetyltransferase n=1 Tax=Pseudomonas matsuisoli TaxID=1515666 RepID=A0A917Q395_9PSED|nr:UDP-4-amino-4,6-dideoxy-N-acetyl-beta-L-altrosamine N-acetyltransferase [Pseudomonas matsuisoli]GGK09168.1 UDP-4-amino-4,6-dideoxy-N-acetyl-beta-L-altrosamine N-acetyltransferase [Pseudomonas matsuisoli]